MNNINGKSMHTTAILATIKLVVKLAIFVT